MVKLPHTATAVQSFKNTTDLINSLDRKHIHPTLCNPYFRSHFKRTEYLWVKSNLQILLYGPLGFKNFEWVAHVLKANFTWKSRLDTIFLSMGAFSTLRLLFPQKVPVEPSRGCSPMGTAAIPVHPPTGPLQVKVLALVSS